MVSERDKDERDLQILKDYDDGASVAVLAKRYNSKQTYVKRLIREAMGED